MGLINWYRNKRAKKLEIEAELEKDITSTEFDEMQQAEETQSIIQPKSVVVDGEIYPSIKAASVVVGCSASTLSEHLRKGDEVYRGHEIGYNA